MVSKLTPDKRILAEELLSQPVLARIATANLETGQPHVVPLWYLWDGASIWIRFPPHKFRELLATPNVVLVKPADPKASKIRPCCSKASGDSWPREMVEGCRACLRCLGKA
jgi:hypothetical protein